MRKISILLVGIILISGGLWFFNGQESLSGMVKQYVENGEFTTLKARYTPEQILESHRKELLVDEHHSFQESGLKFHPYLLMDVKYSQDKKSREGMILWSLVDGEMVLNTESWEKTHGFEDAINADANRNDFKVMQAIARQKGSVITLDHLQKELRAEKDNLADWVESALSKHLIVQKGNELQLHFQDPKILVQPETKVTDWLVKKPYNHAQRVSSQYSTKQIQKAAKAAFGEDFAVRTSSEVFLPVYSIIIANPDGSTFTSYWNAINGQRMTPKFTLQGW